jgi:hypothetical protein
VDVNDAGAACFCDVDIFDGYVLAVGVGEAGDGGI